MNTFLAVILLLLATTIVVVWIAFPFLVLARMDRMQKTLEQMRRQAVEK